MTKPKWLDDHACAFNDGDCECKCFKTAYLQARKEAIQEAIVILEMNLALGKGDVHGDSEAQYKNRILVELIRNLTSKND